MSNNLFHQPGVSKLISLIPSDLTEITRFHVHHRLIVNHVTGWNQTSKRRSLPMTQGRQRDLVDSAKPTMLYVPTYCWNGLRTVGLNSIQSKWREQSLSAFLLWASDYQQDAHMTAMGMLQRACSDANPNS